MDLDSDNLMEPSLDTGEKDNANLDDDCAGKGTYITGIYMNHTSNPHVINNVENLDGKQECFEPSNVIVNRDQEEDPADADCIPLEEYSILKTKPEKVKKKLKLKIKIKRTSKNRRKLEIERQIVGPVSNNNIRQESIDTENRKNSEDPVENEHNNVEKVEDVQADIVHNGPERKKRKPKNQNLNVNKKKTSLKSMQEGGSRIRTFPCDYCPQIFKRMHLRDEHIKDKHPDYYGKYVCLQCHKTFDSRHMLYQHRLRTHEPVGEFVCPVCNSKFTKQSGLKRHIQIHSDNPKWVCSYCARSSFLSKGDMERHIRNRHTGEKPYACKYEGCDRRFTSSGDRAKHYLHHTGEKRFQCTVCGLKMHTSGELKQHTWIHTGERPYICTICGEGFRQSFRLKMHTRIHTGEKPFQCATCGKAFSDKVYLKRHEAIHREERSHVCPKCGKTFKHDSNMRRHVATAHDKKFPYICHECGVGCQGKDEFNRHKAKHNGMRAFNCTICNKGFYTQEDVNSHIKIVHNAVRSSCSVCGTQFKDLRSHKAHLVKIHKVTEETAEEEIQEAKKMKREREAQGLFAGSQDEEQRASTKIWYTCNICQKDFSFFKTLPKHYMKVHKLSRDEAHNISNNEKNTKEGIAYQDCANDQTLKTSLGDGIAGTSVISTIFPAIVTGGMTTDTSSVVTLASFTPVLNSCSMNIQNASNEPVLPKQIPADLVHMRTAVEAWKNSDPYNVLLIKECNHPGPQVPNNVDG